MQINAWFIVIVVALVVLWKVDLIATLLNLKAQGAGIPEVFRDLVDQETYERSQEYGRAKAVLGIGEGIFFLVLLFAFWCLGGFGWLDGQVGASSERAGRSSRGSSTSARSPRVWDCCACPSIGTIPSCSRNTSDSTAPLTRFGSPTS